MTGQAIADSLRISDVIDRVLAMDKRLDIHGSTGAPGRRGIMAGGTDIDVIDAVVMIGHSHMANIASIDVGVHAPRRRVHGVIGDAKEFVLIGNL